MEEYLGFNIPEKIIIVSKPVKNWNKDTREFEPTGEYQGYVVLPDSKSSLESALNWADAKREYVDGKYVYPDYGEYVHEYENGKFSLKIVDSADRSSQGGKLSFWTCELTAPDTRKYLIGINADLLCDFILNNTLKNGEIKDAVYLGRQKARVGIFTRNMASFKQSKQDEEIRNKKSSIKYIPGQKVFSKTEYKVYLGEMYRICKCIGIRSTKSYDSRLATLVVYDEPQKVYVYGDFAYDYDRKTGKRTYDFTKIRYVTISDKKKAYCFNEGEVVKVSDTYQEYINIKQTELDEDIKRIKRVYDRPNELADQKEHIEADMAEFEFKKICYSNDNNKLEITDSIKKIVSNYIEKYISEHYYMIRKADGNDYDIISEKDLLRMSDDVYITED